MEDRKARSQWRKFESCINSNIFVEGLLELCNELIFAEALLKVCILSTMSQGALFPLQIEHDYPYPENTAVLKRMVRAENGLTYAAKGKENTDDYTPVNEYVCARIAEIIGIPVPDYTLLKDFDETLMFGSRWEAGVADSLTHYHLVEEPSIYSSILVFDLLMLNVDRHINNYLIQSVNGTFKLLAFDHSHTLLVLMPLPPPDSVDFFGNDNSLTVLRILKLLKIAIDRKRVKAVLDKFEHIEAKEFDIMVSECSCWMDRKTEIELTDWLKKRHTCIDKILKFLEGWNYDPISILSNITRP